MAVDQGLYNRCLKMGHEVRWVITALEAAESTQDMQEPRSEVIMRRTASQSLQAMQRSSPVGYRRSTCSPRKRVLMGPFSNG